jgi:cellulose biosynthesis protein BcsQ
LLLRRHERARATPEDFSVQSVETHGIAAVGLSDLLRTVEDARESLVNATLIVGAIVATRYNRTREAKDCVQQMRQAFPDTMLQPDAWR